MKNVLVAFLLFTMVEAYTQTTVNPNTGDAYLLFGPNTNWSQYFQVGGNGRVTSHAAIFATNGNLHLDSRNGSFSTYINHYSQGNTILNSQGGKVGIRTTNPKAVLDIGKTLSLGELGSVLARLSEGNSNGNGTYLGIKGYATQGSDINNIKSFALEHSFYGITNSSMNFYRGGSTTGGFITFSTGTNLERLRITNYGYVGVGTTTPDSKLTVKGNIHAEEVKVDLSVPGPDYVFKEEYDLKSLEEVQNYINEHGHLPNIPSAKDMEENGVQLGEMNMKLLEKIEELTLYVIELKMQNELQSRQIQTLLNKEK